MNEFLITMALSTVIKLIQKHIPKDGNTKKEYKKVILKIFKAISEAYKDDPDFKTA